MDYVIGIIIGIIEQTLEYQKWGFNKLTAGAIGVFIFSGFQIWGMYRQGISLEMRVNLKKVMLFPFIGWGT